MNFGLLDRPKYANMCLTIVTEICSLTAKFITNGTLA